MLQLLPDLSQHFVGSLAAGYGVGAAQEAVHAPPLHVMPAEAQHFVASFTAGYGVGAAQLAFTHFAPSHSMPELGQHFVESFFAWNKLGATVQVDDGVTHELLPLSQFIWGLAQHLEESLSAI